MKIGITCAECCSLFEPRSGRVKYCSPACVAAHEKRRKAAWNFGGLVQLEEDSPAPSTDPTEPWEAVCLCCSRTAATYRLTLAEALAMTQRIRCPGCSGRCLLEPVYTRQRRAS